MRIMWLFAVTHKELWLLVSDWLATPGLDRIKNFFRRTLKIIPLLITMFFLFGVPMVICY